ncbi:hypothetical protein GCM10007874_58830 [Labrys miyagiensis]|uniref:Uncharacterized protein n=1 Tax=Labrys miyagiensis TaxID=346912 RepID=A0ABQ6CRA0_9HYPH|nr:hypothetical protein [Labrys miyagiensis]GLS22863.1 hypothetical protein GCM10007874_58830 [Labrys miyagiensis]
MKLFFDPPELQLMHKISVEGVAERTIDSFGGAETFPDLASRVRDRMPNELAPMLDQMTEGDSLWWCRRAKRGPLYGHEGVALVRQGRAIIYLLIMNY